VADLHDETALVVEESHAAQEAAVQPGVGHDLAFVYEAAIAAQQQSAMAERRRTAGLAQSGSGRVDPSEASRSTPRQS
jgi:hypothetical protein